MKKQLVFLVIVLLAAKNVFPSAPPPQYQHLEHSAGPCGKDAIVSAPPSLVIDKYDPTKEVLKGENKAAVYVVENSSCVCLCPIKVSIIPVLHGITTRLSFGLFGAADSTITEENKHADFVDQASYLSVDDDMGKKKA